MTYINIPQKLSKGDKVGFLSPASMPDVDAIEECKAIFESWGLQVEYGKHMVDKIGFLAGTDEVRLSDFNEALRDPEIKGIFATRGGKGAYRIADKLDFKAVARNPQIVYDFSDITVHHMSLYKEYGLIGTHGPMVSWSSEYIDWNG